MISEKYKQLLLRESKQLDILFGIENEFEKLTLEIINDGNARLNLEFIKKLGEFERKYPTLKLNKKQEGISELLFMYLGAREVDETLLYLKNESNKPLPELISQLDSLVGLKSVKQQVQDLIKFNQIQTLREKNGLKKSNNTLHMAFLGNPGTAKTTVARIVGRMYKAIGLLSKGHFIEASRTDLIAEYQGQTAIKVKRLVNRARGGVLFIDEAYSITENDHSDSYGRESLTELTKALEDYRDDLVVIVAGYSELMEHFFDSNPGLKSRFNIFLKFDDYSIEELVDIFKYICQQNDYQANVATLQKVEEYLKVRIAKQDGYFSNGRLVRNLFDEIVINQAKRLYEVGEIVDKEMLVNLEELDVPNELG